MEKNERITVTYRFSKCVSHSIQSYLTENPVISTKEEEKEKEYRYPAFNSQRKEFLSPGQISMHSHFLLELFLLIYRYVMKLIKSS